MLLLKILGFLLKVIGILLLTILALFVTLLLIVLFVPVRYRAKIIREGEKLTVKAQVSWLGSILRIPVTYQEGALDYRAKLFGFTVFPRQKAAPDKEIVPEGAETVSDGANAAETGGETEAPIQSSEVVQIAEAAPEEAGDGSVEGEPEAEEAKGPVGRLLGKLRQVYEAIRAKVQKLIERITETKNRIKQKLVSIKEKGLGLKNRISDVLRFLREEDTTLALKLAGKSIFQLIKYILPYKIKGEVVFGTGDPYSMGQALSVLGIFYGVYARTLQVTADFETTEFRLDARVMLKGRIRMVRILFILLRLWFKGKLKQVIANAKGLIPG